MIYSSVLQTRLYHGIKHFEACHRSDCQGSKIGPVHLYLQLPQAAGQVKILIFLMKIKYFPIYANNFCDAGQALILRYFEAWSAAPDYSSYRLAKNISIREEQTTQVMACWLRVQSS